MSTSLQIVIFYTVTIFSVIYKCECTLESFPVGEFLGYLKVHECYNLEIPTKEEILEKSHLCSSLIENRVCSCDANQCIDQRSCCIDIFWNENNSSVSLSSYVEVFTQRLSRNKTIACQPVTSLKNQLENGSEYMMMSSCPGLTHPDENNNTLRRPVIDSEGLLYTSSNIARCHGVTSYRSVDIEIFELKHSLNITDIEDFNFDDLQSPVIEIVNAGKNKRCDHDVNICYGLKNPNYVEFRKFYRSFRSLKQDNNFRWSLLISFTGDKISIRTPDRKHDGKVVYRKCKINGTSTSDTGLDDFQCTSKTCVTPYEYKNNSCVLTREHKIQATSQRSQYSWEITFLSIEHYIIYYVMPFTIIGYAWAIMIFMYFKELQNLPRLNSVCMTITLLVGDTVYYTGYQMSEHSVTNGTFCKIHAIVTQGCFISAAIWAFLTAAELAYCFSQNVLIPNKVNKRRFMLYVTLSIFIPTILVLMTWLFDINGIITAGFGDGGICWMSAFKSRLFFYIIPISVSYITTLSMLVIIIGSLAKQINSIRPVMKLSATHGHKVVKFVLNLSLVLGVSEIAGFVQIRKEGITERELIVNAVFQVIYTVLRTSRGILIALVYVTSKSTTRVLRMSLRKRFPRLFSTWSNRSVNRQRTSSSVHSFEMTSSSLSSSNNNNYRSGGRRSRSSSRN